MKTAYLTIKFNDLRYAHNIPYTTPTYIGDVVKGTKFFIKALGKENPYCTLDNITYIEVQDEEGKHLFLCETKVECEIFLETGIDVYLLTLVIQDTDSVGWKHIEFLLKNYAQLNLSILKCEHIK